MNYRPQQRPFSANRPPGRPQQERQPVAKVDPTAKLDAADLSTLLTTWADAAGRRLSGASATTTAVRRFYGEFVAIANDGPKSDEVALAQDVRTRLKLLIPRALYAQQRKNAAIPPELATLVVQLVNYATDAQKLADARAIFEAVLGYAVNYGLRNR